MKTFDILIFGCKITGIKKSEFVAKTKVLLFKFIFAKVAQISVK